MSIPQPVEEEDYYPEMTFWKTVWASALGFFVAIGLYTILVLLAAMFQGGIINITIPAKELPPMSIPTPDEITWQPAYGAAQPVEGSRGKQPVAFRSKNSIIFAFYDGDGAGYHVHAPFLTVAEGRAVIQRRIKAFKATPHSRESFPDKVRRKWLAAHGPEYVLGLQKAARGHERMEWDMMFPANTHHSTLARDESDRIIFGAEIGLARFITLNRTGDMDYATEPSLKLATNDGRVYRARA